MPRLGQIRRDDTDDPLVNGVYDMMFGDRDPVDEPGTNTGTPGDWWTVFANVPEVLKHCVDGFALYRWTEELVDPELRELGQTRAGWARGSQFVFSQHCKSCRDLGMSEEKIAAIPAWQTSDEFSPVERAVLAYTDALVYDGGRIADGVFDELRSHFGDRQILALTYTTCLYEMHATMSRALRTEFDDVPERIVEVEGPDDAAPWDVALRSQD